MAIKTISITNSKNEYARCVVCVRTKLIKWIEIIYDRTVGNFEIVE